MPNSQNFKLDFRALKYGEIAFAVDAYMEMLKEISSYDEIDILPTQKTLETAERILIENYRAGNECYVALDNRQIIGYSLVMEQLAMDLKCRTFNGLGLYVEPEYRKLGIGVALIGYTLDRLKEKGVKKFFASFIQERPTSNKIIETFGFVKTNHIVCKTF